MSEQRDSQSFNVDDIRRIREEADIRYRGMTYEEITRDITEGAKVGYQILEQIRKAKKEQQGA
jgi:hypothetical protein